MNSQKKRGQARAQRLLDRMMPFDRWVSLQPRTGEEIELARRLEARLRHIAAHEEVTSAEFKQKQKRPYRRALG